MVLDEYQRIYNGIILHNGVYYLRFNHVWIIAMYVHISFFEWAYRLLPIFFSLRIHRQRFVQFH